ncbi:hypothetical protein M8C21_006889, partial [Ambrosia artemisiifolia]
ARDEIKQLMEDDDADIIIDIWFPTRKRKSLGIDAQSDLPSTSDASVNASFYVDYDEPTLICESLPLTKGPGDGVYSVLLANKMKSRRL